jgi:DNA-binding PadR family transcriptional regulator
MAKHGNLTYGLLGFLVDGPLSGYQLGKLFHKNYKPALSLIYRKLKQMTAEGLVRIEKVAQETVPDKNVIYITARGRKELERWLKEPKRPEPTRDPLFIQLWYGSSVDKKYILRNLAAYDAFIKLELGYYHRLLGKSVAIQQKDNGLSIKALYQTLSLEYQLRSRELIIDWIADAIARISNHKTE